MTARHMPVSRSMGASTSWYFLLASGVSKVVLLWKDVGNSKKVSAAALKVDSRMPPFLRMTCSVA